MWSTWWQTTSPTSRRSDQRATSPSGSPSQGRGEFSHPFRLQLLSFRLLFFLQKHGNRRGKRWSVPPGEGLPRVPPGERLPRVRLGRHRGLPRVRLGRHRRLPRVRLVKRLRLIVQDDARRSGSGHFRDNSTNGRLGQFCSWNFQTYPTKLIRSFTRTESPPCICPICYFDHLV